MATYTVEILTNALIARALDGTKRLVKTTFKTKKDKDSEFIADAVIATIDSDSDNDTQDEETITTEKQPKAKHINRGVIVPIIPAAAGCVDILRDAFQGAFEELQNKVIREIIVNALDAGLQNADGTLKVITISDEQISMEACATYYANSAESGKLSKAVINTWFDTDLDDDLTLKFATQLKLPQQPTAKQIAALEKGVSEYKQLYACLANPKERLPETIAKQLLAACKSAPDSRTKQSIISKLQPMTQPKEIALSIGFIDTEESEEETTGTQP